MVDPTVPIALQLQSTHMVITHHSNVGADGLFNGVPVHSRYGPARHVSTPLQSIETPVYCERKPFFNRLAYCQWSLSEMSSGLAWEWLRRFHLGRAG